MGATDNRTTQVSTRAVISGALDQFITRLGEEPTTPERSAKLQEALRLRHIVETWEAAPPTDEAERQTLGLTMDLVGSMPTGRSG